MMSSQRTWRRLSAWLAAYALALHVVLLSFAPIPAATAASDDAVGFALCLHDGGDVSDPAAPTGHSDEHCPFCVVNGHSSVAALPRVPLPLGFDYASMLSWVVTSDDLPDARASVRTQPRGPPLSA
jgi:hypothetical protein